MYMYKYTHVYTCTCTCARSNITHVTEFFTFIIIMYSWRKLMSTCTIMYVHVQCTCVKVVVNIALQELSGGHDDSSLPDEERSSPAQSLIKLTALIKLVISCPTIFFSSSLPHFLSPFQGVYHCGDCSW